MVKRAISHLLPWFCSLLLLSTACGDDAPDRARDAGHDQTPLDGGRPDLDAASVADAGTEDAGAADAGHPGDASLGEPHWFEGAEPLALSASGSFGDAFAAAFAGLPDGIFPPTRLKDPFAGQLGYRFLDGSQHQVPVTFTVRGNSSLQECAFPKLKLELEARSQVPEDLLYAIKKLKIGTHCGEDEAVNGTIGRFCNQLSAFREELVYQLARELGILTLATRPARITYTDTSSEPAFDAPLERQAFLLEHIDELARRLGAVALKDPSDCGAEPGATDPVDVLRVKMFHALVGNWDFGLGSLESGGCDALWNTEVLVHADGSLTLVPADFDLAAMVVGEIRSQGAISLQNATDYARENLATYLAGEPEPAVAAMEAEFVAKRSALEALIDASGVDGAGKASAHLLLDGFFAALAE